jgi:hypothetical protein
MVVGAFKIFVKGKIIRGEFFGVMDYRFGGGMVLDLVPETRGVVGGAAAALLSHQLTF